MYSFYDFFAIMILKIPDDSWSFGNILTEMRNFIMSFTGIFKAKNGIVAVVDSKASRVENGQSYEDVHRNPEKLFVFQNGIATTFGANQILVQNPLNFPQKSLPSKIWFMNIYI